MPAQKLEPPVERVRLQVEMTKDRLESIDKLVDITGMGTRKEFLDNALVLLAWAVRERQKGRTIASVSTDGASFREVMMPCLELTFQQHEPDSKEGPPS